ncbi:MAG: chloride channel protein [Planctomycetota bacterium]
MARPFGRFREAIGNVQSDFAVLALVGIIVGLGSGVAGLGLHIGLAGIRPEVEGIHDRLPWLFPLLPAVGALASWWILDRLTHYKGRGISDVIWSAYREGGHMPRESMFTQMLGSVLTVGLGGSAGPEGPIAFTGAAIGSNVGTAFRLSEKRRTTLLCCGVAGACSAIFNAPVTGMFFAIEVVMGQWVSTQVLPIALSSVVANLVALAFIGKDQTIFEVPVYETGTFDLAFCLGLALLAGLSSFLLQRGIHLSNAAFKRLPVRPWARPFIGGLLVGLIGIALPQVLAEGYSETESLLNGELTLGLWVVALVFVAKAVATSLTLGSGGCGGIFAPTLLVGASLGTLYHGFLSQVFPGAEIAKVGAYAVLGMAAVLGSTLHAPVTAIFMVAEITGSPITGTGDLLIPLIVVTAAATLVTQHLWPGSFYHRKLEERAGSQGIALDARILADLGLDELIEPVQTSLEEDMTVAKAHDVVVDCDLDLYPVIDRDGRYLGMVRSLYLLSVDRTAATLMLVSDLMDARWPVVQDDARPATLFALFEQNDCSVAPVVDADGKVRGNIRAESFLRRYHQELLVHTAR